MMIKKLLLQSTKQLQNVKLDSAQLDAKILLKRVTGFSDLDLALRGDEHLNEKQLDEFNSLMERRLQYEPIAYIIGHKEFWGLDFKVTRDTLIPRPASELFIETALERFDESAPLRILDLGTGSGCLILSLLHSFPKATGMGVDLSPDALEVANHNARHLKLKERVQFIHSNWCEHVTGEFDLIISNPPYIPESEELMPDVGEFEPNSALYGGESGIMAYETLIPQLKRHTHQKTEFYCEIGQGQTPEVTLILNRYNMCVLDVKKDLQAIERIIIADFFTNS